MIPVVEGVMDVHALVALQPHELSARRRRQSTRDLGLAHPGFALQQQRELQGPREVDAGRQRPVGQVALTGERRDDGVH